eukprot:5334859-Pleurochrysis_carterae.AAC.2
MTPPLEELTTDDAQVCATHLWPPTFVLVSIVLSLQPHPHGESAEIPAHRLCGDVELEMATARVGANPRLRDCAVQHGGRLCCG